MEENLYKNSVKVLTGRNREVKLHGQSREGRKQDPRQLFNEKEVKERERVWSIHASLLLMVTPKYFAISVSPNLVS